MSNERWRIELVEVTESLPVLWRPSDWQEKPGPPSGEFAVSVLMSAFDLLARRGSGGTSWRTFYRQDPIAFLLDAMGDAVSLWGQGGELVYRNRAAEQLGLGWGNEVTHEVFTSAGRKFERRCLHFRHGIADYVLEIVHEGHEPAKSRKSRAGLGRSRGRQGSKTSA